MSRPGKRRGLPDRWLDYKPVGRRLDGTRFIAFKVPLKKSLSHQLAPSEVFGPLELLDAVNNQNQELGLIIDLTFTTRYYRPQDVPEPLMCVKILTAGHQIPTDDTILSFKRAVRRFLRENADNDRLVGVHCTHGLNRTGYLICRYLIDVDGMNPADAVELFNSSRGHDIERPNYLHDLRCGPKRSNDGMDECELEAVRGGSAQRPGYALSGPRSSEGRRPHPQDSSYHRVPTHRPHHRHPHEGLLPFQPFPPQPPFRPLMHPYRWPPGPGSQWMRPPRVDDGRPRYPLQGERRGAPHPPPLPPFSTNWANQSRRNDYDEAYEWAGPNQRHQYRH